MSSPLCLLADEAATRRLGLELGRACPLPLLIALNGELGAGKTTLSQAIGLGFGVEGPMPSPTFTLINEYSAPRGRLFHLDLYRLDSADELFELGFDDLLARPDALILVEWFDRFADWPAALPILRLELAHREPGRELRAAIPDAYPQLARCFEG